MNDEKYAKRARSAKTQVWLAGRASREDTMLNRFLRRLMKRALAQDPEKDFMRDELIDNDVGFDPDELDRYQRGE